MFLIFCFLFFLKCVLTLSPIRLLFQQTVLVGLPKVKFLPLPKNIYNSVKFEDIFMKLGNRIVFLKFFHMQVSDLKNINIYCENLTFQNFRNFVPDRAHVWEKGLRNVCNHIGRKCRYTVYQFFLYKLVKFKTVTSILKKIIVY